MVSPSKGRGISHLQFKKIMRVKFFRKAYFTAMKISISASDGFCAGVLFI